MKNTTIALLVIALLALGGWVAYAQFVPGASVSPSTTTDENTGKKVAKDTPYFDWTFTVKPEVQGMPQTAVQLSSNGHVYDLGTYTGSCSRIGDSSWPLVVGEVDGAICWYAGGGDEIGIFKEGVNFVVKKGVLDEGSAETPGVRGNFTTLITLEEM